MFLVYNLQILQPKTLVCNVQFVATAEIHSATNQKIKEFIVYDQAAYRYINF